MNKFERTWSNKAIDLLAGDCLAIGNISPHHSDPGYVPPGPNVTDTLEQ